MSQGATAICKGKAVPHTPKEPLKDRLRKTGGLIMMC